MTPYDRLKSERAKRSMPPGQVHMLLELYFRADDYRDGDYNAPAVIEWVGDFKKRGIIEINRGAEPGDLRTYRVTDKGRALVNAICSVPDPVARWVVDGKEVDCR